jgi:hypothetical protein
MRALRRGLEQGEILQAGTGRKNDPYRYWLPGKEEDFYPGLGATKEQIERWKERQDRRVEEWFDSLPETPGERRMPAGAGGAEEAPGEGALPAEPRPPAPPVAEPPADSQPEPAAEVGGAGPAAPAEPKPVKPAEPVVSGVENRIPPPSPSRPATGARPAEQTGPAVDPAEELARERRRWRRWPYG